MVLVFLGLSETVFGDSSGITSRLVVDGDDYPIQFVLTENDQVKAELNHGSEKNRPSEFSVHKSGETVKVTAKFRKKTFFSRGGEVIKDSTLVIHVPKSNLNTIEVTSITGPIDARVLPDSLQQLSISNVVGANHVLTSASRIEIGSVMSKTNLELTGSQQVVDVKDVNGSLEVAMPRQSITYKVTTRGRAEIFNQFLDEDITGRVNESFKSSPSSHSITYVSTIGKLKVIEK